MMTGETWTQSTPPPAGVTYEWVGERNNSQSVKRIDGAWASRNYIHTPIVSEDRSNWALTSGVNRSLLPGVGAHLKIVGDNPIPAAQQVFWWGASAPTMNPGDNSPVTVRFEITVPEGAPRPVSLRPRINVAYSDSTPTDWNTGAPVTIAPGETAALTHEVRTGANTASITPALLGQAQQQLSLGDEFIVHDGITLTLSSAIPDPPSFSGDTPDDRDGDTWLNPEEYKEYVWDSATKDWIPNPAAVSLSDNLFIDPYFDKGMTHWGSGAQGGSTQGAVQGLSDINTFPGHRHSFALGPYAPGASGQAAGPLPLPADRPQVKQGDVLQGSAWVMRGPGSTTGSEAVELRPWRSPSTGTTVTGVMASVRVADMPVGEWVQVSGSWTLQEEGAYTGLTRVYYTPHGTWGGDAPGVWIGYMFTAVNPGPPKGGVTEVDVSTSARQGIIADVSARGHDKVPLALADVADEYRAGQRVALAAAARSAADLVWKWRQVQGPEVELNATGNTATFIAPNVTEPTNMRIAVMASSVTGQSRSDWKFFDLTVGPAFASYRADPDVADPASVMPAISGYERGAYEVWNGTLPPPTMPPAPRRQAEIIDIGAMLNDVQVGEQFPESAPGGGFFINSVTGDVFRNFGDGYNETESSRAGAPRRGAIWHDPGTGDLLRWIED